MAGVKGAGGPVPKRSSQRRRRNKDSEPETAPAAPAKLAEQPEPDAEWHPVARQWYEALAESGQAAFYEPSDWATAYLLAESMSRELQPQFVGMEETVDEDGNEVTRPVYVDRPMKGASLAAYLKAMTALLVTEGDRRRARLELERPHPGAADTEPADVPVLDDYRRRALGG